MMKLISIAMLSFTFIACKQSMPIDSDKERIDSVCNKFMQTFKEGNLPEAFELLKPNSVMSRSSIDTLQNKVTILINNVLPSYGKVGSYEFIIERKIKDFITKRFYILKFDKFYWKFDFTIYKSNKGWTITGFTCNEELIELLY